MTQLNLHQLFDTLTVEEAILLTVEGLANMCYPGVVNSAEYCLQEEADARRRFEIDFYSVLGEAFQMILGRPATEIEGGFMEEAARQAGIYFDVDSWKAAYTDRERAEF